MSSNQNDLKNVVPPIAVYHGVGNPYKTSLTEMQNNSKNQNDLNNKHGGKAYKNRRKNKKRVRFGGATTSSTRPQQMVIPQAPTGGVQAQGPITANDMSAHSSQTLMNHYVNSQYDNKVVVPPIPQSGGTNLLHRLERLVKDSKRKTRKLKKNRKQRKRRSGSTRRVKKHYGKKK